MDKTAKYDLFISYVDADRAWVKGYLMDALDRSGIRYHEALISGWPKLQQWIAQRREAEQTRWQLEAKVKEWVRLGKSSGGLLDEVELAEAERWLNSSDAADLGYDKALPALVAASVKAIQVAKRRVVTESNFGI